MIKIYEEKVFWVLLSLLCWVLIILGSVKFCQIISKIFSRERNQRILFIEEGIDTDDIVINPIREQLIEEVLTTIKQSDINLAPPVYSTLSKASARATYELPPPYPIILHV
ncbi:hypothetical protein ABEB36_009641 [Hypothenemus hampei]|uniref:Uncharacterized protein n=1 Tax=Hypothenemus hampei TaxID=57062 RepID=A0ABD1EGY8_HYPHA